MQQVVHMVDYQRSIVLAANTEIIVCTTCMQINEIKLSFASSLLKIVWPDFVIASPKIRW